MKPLRTLFSALAFASLLAAGCGKSSAPANDAAQNSSAPNASSDSPQAGQAMQQKATPAKPVPPPPIEIPAGTTLSVSLSGTVSSKTSAAGQPFEGSLAAPIVVGDIVAVPKGAQVSGTVTQAHAAGKFKGAATLGLSLTSLTVNGTPYTIHCSPFLQETKGKGKRTAEVIGGGAAVGALIGGLAGGGKGAAIGAGIGAGGGTAGAAYTGNNRDITLGAESTVNFKLAEPVSIQRN
ncbi:MAG TPA: hypothetical protein VMT51_07090 [Dongiaceae bacterium]|nr:hypothetical protein [Dongiaceae bacterium]